MPPVRRDASHALSSNVARNIRSPAHNAAQQAILDEQWRYKFDQERPDKKRSIMCSVFCAEVGPFITSQEIGKYFANRAAAETGRPRATRKTPEQLTLLENSYKKDPYPKVGESILLVHDTGLTATQVKNWFQNQRDKSTGPMYTRNDLSDPAKALKMWRGYKADPDGYVAMLRDGTVSMVTGEVLRVDSPSPAIANDGLKAESPIHNFNTDSPSDGVKAESPVDGLKAESDND